VTVVSNTSPITNLAAIRQLDLLQQLYTQIVIPEAVYNELTGVETPVPGTREVQDLDWIQVRPVVNPSFVIALQQEPLDLGEAEAIALARELNADRLLIDERKGRAVASRLGIKLTGVLGILIVAKRRELIPKIKPLIDELIDISRFRVSDELYARVLQDVGE
jgi:predicted nucleic acid-binding protein